MNEEDLYSIQRRKYKSQNINSKIKELNTKIEKIKEKIEVIKAKEQKMKEYIAKLKEKYNLLNRPPTLSFYGKDSSFIKKSLFNGDYIKEEISDDENNSNLVENNHKNKENEIFKKINKNKINKNIKKSVFVEISHEKKANLRVDFNDLFLKHKSKEKKKANSK